MKKLTKVKTMILVSKMCKEYKEANRKKIEKNFKVKKLLGCGIGPEEYNITFACELEKQIWNV